MKQGYFFFNLHYLKIVTGNNKQQSHKIFSGYLLL